MNQTTMARDELILLAKRIQDAQDRGEDHASLLTRLQQHVLYPKMSELFLGDYSAEYIIDYALNWQPEWPMLSKQQMVDLTSKLINAKGTQAELAIMTLMFDANCSHPAKSDLIYYPEEHFENVLDISPLEIVERALSATGDGNGDATL